MWDDIKYFLAVARHGSTLSAAKALRLSQSTIHRRLVELEHRLGRQLVKRHPTGYELTPIGIEMRAYAEQIEAAVHEFERRLAASASEMTGSVRVTCPEAFGSRLMRSTLIERFNRRYPDLNVEFLIGNNILDLGKGQADIAIRASLPTDNALFGRKIGEISWALYASKSYLDKYGPIESLEDIDRHAIVLFDGELSNHPASAWLKSVAPNAKVVARSRNLPTLLLAVQSGAGIAPMPTTVESRDRTLVRLLGPIPELSRPLHLLVHKDMRSTPRIRAFYDYIVQEVREIRTLLIADHDAAGADIEQSDLR